MQSAIWVGSTSHRRYWFGLAFGVIIVITVLRMGYLLFACPLDLVPDEAHYWDWSRNLDWSYYSKGPLVAWLIRASVELFGPLARSISGSEMPAVRFPAVVSGALLLLGLFQLTRQTFGDNRLAFCVVLACCTLPVMSLGSILMTIDAPFTCCWCWALVTAHQAIVREKRWAWPVTGVLVGIGILAKYTMGLWLLSLGLFLCFTRGYRELLRTARFWGMIAIVAVCCVPILIWNLQNDWVTFRHVAGQAGVSTLPNRNGIRWFGPIIYLSTQFGILLGYWFIVWAAGMIAFRPGKVQDPGILFLWWLSLPTFVLFGVVSFRSAGQPNWPVAGYLSGIPLGAAWLAAQIYSPASGYRKLSRIGVAGALLVGILGSLLMHDTRPLRPAMVEVVGAPTDRQPFPLRKIDPTCRLRGWKYLAHQVDEIRQTVEAEDGVPAQIAAINWSVPGELAFYCKGHPQVYSFGLELGDRHSQYDLWRPNPIADAQVFLGQTFIIVGPRIGVLKDMFDSVGASREVVYSEQGHPIAGWTVTVYRGYRGLSSSSPRSQKPSY